MEDGTLKFSPEEGKEEGFQIPLMQSKIDVQNQLITLMQTQIDMQSEKIAKQGLDIEKLLMEVEQLKIQVLQLEHNKHDGQNSKPTVEDITVVDGTTAKAETKSNVDVKRKEPSKTASTNKSITEMARETAEATMANSGFVYDENSGLYFDYSSGYYYDAKRQLYYNGHTRTYYSYNEDSGEYIFHSQLPLEIAAKTRKRRSKKIKRRDWTLKQKSVQVDMVNLETLSMKANNSASDTTDSTDMEEGELSADDDMNSDCNSIRIIEKSESSSDGSDAGTIELCSDSEDEGNGTNSDTTPPCIRATVLESGIPELKIGFLFIVTCIGGTIGREGSQHVMLLPGYGISREHARITYEFADVSVEDPRKESTAKPNHTKKYFIADLGSQSGTILNGKRLSRSLVPSDKHELVHGSFLTIGNTRLLIHIHDGLMTCGHCEPGLFLAKRAPANSVGNVFRAIDKEESQKNSLHKIRQKYAIRVTQADSIPKLMEKYKDRAEARRNLQGSEHDSFKTVQSPPASIHVPIAKENKGFKMLQKMGWTDGESLGNPRNSGVREPVKFQVKLGREGLGTTKLASMNDLGMTETEPLRPYQKRKLQNLQKTTKRYLASNESSQSSNQYPPLKVTRRELKRSPSKEEVIELE